VRIGPVRAAAAHAPAHAHAAACTQV